MNRQTGVSPSGEVFVFKAKGSPTERVQVVGGRFYYLLNLKSSVTYGLGQWQTTEERWQAVEVGA